MAEGEIFSDAEVQKSALQIIINSVCGPVTRVSTILLGCTLIGSEYWVSIHCEMV